MASDLPPEVLNIIFSHHSDKAALLKHAQVCKAWAATIYSLYVYKTLKLTTPVALQKCLNVFSHTAVNRKFRAQYNWSRLVSRQLGIADESSESTFQIPHDFYSTRNYGLLVREIDLSEFQGKGVITDRVIEQLANNCRYLRSVNLYNCHEVTDSAIEYLATKCHHLENIYLAGLTTLTGSFLQTLRVSCPKLHIMNLNLCFNISSPSIVEATENFRIVTLKLDKVILVDQDLLMIAQNCAQTLTTLSLNDCRITDTAINEVSRICPNLQHLSISGLHTLNLTCLPPALRILHTPKNILTVATVSTILRDARHTLRSISLSLTGSRVDFSSFNTILKACSSLERVSLACAQLQRDLCLSLHHLAEANLSHLTLNRCIVVDQNAFVAMLGRAATRCLCYLDLSDTVFIPQELLYIMSLKPGAEKLETLILSGVDHMLTSQTTLYALPRWFPRLRVLGVSGLHSVDDAVVEALVEGLEALQVLDLSRCNNVRKKANQQRRMVEAAGWWKVKDEVW